MIPSFGQAVPAGVAQPVSTGFALPTTQGSLRYSIGVNESISSGYYGSGTDSQTGVNGSLGFISTSQLYPFSMVFSGGDSWSSRGDLPSTYFLNLGLSQVITTRNWNFVLSDSIGYLPQTPSIGLSGLPGTGDVGLAPIIGGTDGQGILTNYSARVTNTSSLGAGLHLSGRTSLQFSGTYSILDFTQPVSGESNSTSYSGSAGLNHRIDARNTVSVNYSYSKYNYGVGQPSVTSQTVAGTLTHQFTRQFGVSISAGPQWSSYVDFVPAQPSSISSYVAASANYTGEFTSYSLNYSRGTNAGSGIAIGARSDNVGFRASRTFARVWNGSITSSYAHTTGLQSSLNAQGFAPQTVVGSVQISRSITRSLSGYGSYTVEDQTNVGSIAGNGAFSGLYKVAAFGLTFSPSPLHFGPR